IAALNGHRSTAFVSNGKIPSIKPVTPALSGESPFTRQYESVRYPLGSATAPSFGMPHVTSLFHYLAFRLRRNLCWQVPDEELYAAVRRRRSRHPRIL